MTLLERVKLPVDRKKGAAGAVLGLAAFLLFVIFYGSAKYGLLFAGMFVIAGLFRLPDKAVRWSFVLHILWTAACLAVAFLMPYNEIFPRATLSVYRTEIFVCLSRKTVVLNLLVVFVLISVLYLITLRYKLSVALGTLIPMGFAFFNGLVYQFRGNELIFADLMSVKTAAIVVGQYVISVHYRTACLLALWSVLILGGMGLPGTAPRKPLGRRLVSLALSLALFGALSMGAADVPIKMWNYEGTLLNGYYLNFYLSIRGYFVEKPEGYSRQEIARMETEYPENREVPASGELPHILVIMNESFADFRIGGGRLQTNRDVMPFLDSLQENTVKGYALASVFGGSTANSEYEFLTGSTMAFIPKGAIPYQQYIKQETACLVRDLEALGYEGMVTHPYYENGWSRPVVYPLMGFDRRTFIDDYPCEQIIREFVGDREMYAYVLDVLQEQQTPLFLYGITMQNHGGYTYSGDRFEKTVSLEGYSQEYPMAEQYLSLVNQSDAALEFFLTELSRRDEKVVVLFFGDHMPNIEKAFFGEVFDSSFSTLQEQQLQYTVPFVIWANYDIPEQTVGCTSLNYLGRHLLETAGLPLPPYYQFLKELESVIPAVNANGYYSVSQQTYLPLEEAQGEEARWLNRYAQLQYNGLFDKKGRSDVFFPVD